MDIRQIEIFSATIESGSMTAAARSLGITQPAVSSALGRLEGAVGFKLFDREGRQIVPTAEARLLHQDILQALAGVAHLDEAASLIRAAQRGHLTVATSPGPGIAWLPQIAAGFINDRPGVTVRFLTRSSREVRDLLTARAFDLGIAEAPFDRKDAVVRRYRFDCVAVLPAGHPLGLAPELTPSLIEPYPLIVLLPGHGTTVPIRRAFEATGAQARVVAECEFFATALNLVMHGAGVCIADPISAAEAAAGRDLIIKPFRPAIPFEVGILRQLRGSTSRLADDFVQHIDRLVRLYLA